MDLCVLVLETRFTVMQNIEGVLLGDTLALSYVYPCMDIDSHVSVP